MTRPVDVATSSNGKSAVGDGGKKSLISIGNYQMTRTLGKGNFAKVVEGTHTILNTKVAIKIIDTSRITQDYVIKNLTREAKLLSMLHHPSIVRLYETIQFGAMYFLVTELATGGDLSTHVRSQPNGRLDETSARSYTRQLVAALRHMHSRDIVHRDLKMENIMLQDSKKERIKIVDFGLSNKFDDVNPLKTQCGSPEYAAPELFVKGKKYGPEVDLWSLGVILYVMGSGRLPFLSPRDGQTSAEERRRRLMAQINRGLTTIQERAILSLSTEYKNLVKRLLTPIAQKRIGIRELCRHPWIIGKEKSSLIVDASVAEFEKLDDKYHELIVSELMSFTDYNRQTIEMDIVNKRFGRIGGMYNIMTHELERNNLIYDIKKKRFSTFRASKRNLNKSHVQSKNCRNKLIQTNLKTKSTNENQTSSKIKINGTFSIVEYDRSSKKIIQSKPVRRQIVVKEMSNLTNHMLFPSKKLTNSNSTVDKRPMTQLPTKQVPTLAASLQNRSFRPLSEESRLNRRKPIIKLRKNKISPRYKSAIPQRTAQGIPRTNILRSNTSANNQDGNQQTIFKSSKNRSAPIQRTDVNGSDTKNIHDKMSDSVIKTKFVRRKEGSAKSYLKRPRNYIKSLDKFKWKSFIIQQDRYTNTNKAKRKI